ncbi:unannotated protein [freshwater metagenome]|uniref:Unannotated protein n=1 Tax=freshwater metagenome TaxID=449393 RepID=A0A6J6PVW3_9ZZZZ|nr:hypothetical protein [Actinomycetota bacterium]MSY16869.1 hypothetical protein [Actinomycetota bacterium]MSY41757.1 hypothetical protein [Actinomycetota bacterium]
MPSVEVSSPASSAPTDRLALGVGWVRPGAGGIAGSLNPSRLTAFGFLCDYCFEGSEE